MKDIIARAFCHRKKLRIERRGYQHGPVGELSINATRDVRMLFLCLRGVVMFSCRLEKKWTTINDMTPLSMIDAVDIKCVVMFSLSSFLYSASCFVLNIVDLLTCSV